VPITLAGRVILPRSPGPAAAPPRWKSSAAN